MHDTFLFTKISKSLKQICMENSIERISYLVIVVHYNSHVNEESLKQYLKEQEPELIDENFKAMVWKKDIEEQTAIIECVEGEAYTKNENILIEKD